MAKKCILSFTAPMDSSISESLPFVFAKSTMLEHSEAMSQTLSKELVENVLLNTIGPLLQDQFYTRCTISDTRYIQVDPRWVLGLINSDPILAPASYKNDVFDCDDYALYLKTKVALYAAQSQLSFPLAVGYLLTCRHAFNICISISANNEPALYIINTQSNNRDFVFDVPSYYSFLGITSSNYIQAVYI